MLVINLVLKFGVGWIEYIVNNRWLKLFNLVINFKLLKKGSDSISEFVFKIKNIGDALMAAGEEVKDRDLVNYVLS